MSDTMFEDVKTPKWYEDALVNPCRKSHRRPLIDTNKPRIIVCSQNASVNEQVNVRGRVVERPPHTTWDYPYLLNDDQSRSSSKSQYTNLIPRSRSVRYAESYVSPYAYSGRQLQHSTESKSSNTVTSNKQAYERVHGQGVQSVNNTVYRVPQIHAHKLKTVNSFVSEVVSLTSSTYPINKPKVSSLNVPTTISKSEVVSATGRKLQSTQSSCRARGGMDTIKKTNSRASSAKESVKKLKGSEITIKASRDTTHSRQRSGTQVICKNDDNNEFPCTIDTLVGMAQYMLRQNKIIAAQNPDFKTLKARDYLNSSITSVLLRGIQDLIRERPTDPITFLAKFLIKHKDYKNGDKID